MKQTNLLIVFLLVYILVFINISCGLNLSWSNFEIDHIVHLNGTIENRVVNVQPDESWYRPNPNIPVVTIIIQETLWKVRPINADINITGISNSTPSDNRHRIIISSSVSNNPVWINTTISEFANRLCQLRRNNIAITNVQADETGFLSYLYDGGFSTYEFEYILGESTGNLSGYINSISNNPIENAKVYLSYINGSYLAEVNTSADGSYNYTNVNVSNQYYIFAKWINESSAKSSNFIITSNSTIWQNLTLIDSYNVVNGQNVFINLSNSFDFETDSLNYSCNRTYLFTDFNTTTGKGNWTTSSDGTYAIKFGSSDDVGYSNKTILFTVISKYNISGYVNDTLGAAINAVSIVNGTNLTTTNATGYYQIILMTNGTWNFTYSKAGYSTNYKEITISGADVLNQNVTLTLATSSITIPANSWGMFNNWSYITTFSNIAVNESNDVTYTFYNVTSGEWDSYYPGYSWNADQTVDKNYSVMGFFNAQTTITANTVTPWNTSITEGWNMLYLMGTTNRTLTDICTNMVNCTDIYYYNSTTNDYISTGTNTIQPNQGFLAYVNHTGTWIRSTI